MTSRIHAMQRLPAYSSANPSLHRVHTYTAHALILLNFYGIPLSSGLWLEYYFTDLYPSASLLAISATFGAQVACLGLGVGTTALLYRQWSKHWRLQMFLSALSVWGAHLGLLVTGNLWVLALCQGALTGLGLGVLGAVSTKVLSTHYRNDTAAASTQCVAAGFFGTAVHTGLTWICLRSDNMRLGRGITLTLLCLTLLPSMLLANPSAPYALRSSPPATSSTGPRTIRFTLFSLLATLSLAPCLLPPLLLPLLLTRHPSPYRADTGCYALVALYSAGLCSSALFPKLPSRRLSPTTLVSASALLAGISVIPLLWMTSLYVAVPCAAVFGLALGGICTLSFKALAVLTGGQELESRKYLLVAVGGVGAACALVGSAVVLERWKAGVEIVLGAVAGCLGLGGLVVGVGAALRNCGQQKGWVT